MPLTGGLPGVASREEGPVNTTLLSFTCSMACGAVVLMPTLPICAVLFILISTDRMAKYGLIFMVCFLNQIIYHLVFLLFSIQQLQ
jgi:hypothetical protein